MYPSVRRLLFFKRAIKMKKTAGCLVEAKLRAEQMHLPYAGVLTPQEAYEVWQANPQACLVDVRTCAELDWVGRIPGAIEIEWNSYPGSVPNPLFLTQLAKRVDVQAPLLFICRSGARSHNAAMAAVEVGYLDVYNVLEGFEGDKDANNHRGTTGGWRYAGLPWQQS
jgi:rhodanese-related sulfurtransferase